MVPLTIPATPRASHRHRPLHPKPAPHRPLLLPLLTLLLLLLTLTHLPPTLRFPSTSRPQNLTTTPTPPPVSLPRLDLSHTDTAFCPALTASPVPHHRACARSSANHTCTAGPHRGRPTFFGGHAQDFYVWTRHFARLARPGVYLDVATNDPVSMSNTFFLDRCAHWHGFCVEANPVYLEKIFRLRSCALVPTCVGARDGEIVRFGLDGQKGGVVGETNRHARDGKVDVGTVMNMRCLSLKALLTRRAVELVDFLSLDVEGHELAALQGVEWERVRINVIVVEVTGKTVDHIQAFLEGKGYVRHTPDLDERSRRTSLLGEDAVFLRHDVVWGHPV